MSDDEGGRPRDAHGGGYSSSGGDGDAAPAQQREEWMTVARPLTGRSRDDEAEKRAAEEAEAKAKQEVCGFCGRSANHTHAANAPAVGALSQPHMLPSEDAASRIRCH